MSRRHRPQSAVKRKEPATGFRQNYGVYGVVYILENPGLARGFYKIGCSSRSGRIRAAELNREASTGTPGMFRVVVEYSTEDCGRAEQAAFSELAQHRRGKRGQEFFQVDLEVAKEVVARICQKIDQDSKVQDANLRRAAILAALDAARRADAALKPPRYTQDPLAVPAGLKTRLHSMT